MAEYGLQADLRSHGLSDALRALGLAAPKVTVLLNELLVAQAETLKAALEEATPLAVHQPWEPERPHAKYSYSVRVLGPGRVVITNPVLAAHLLVHGVVRHDITASRRPYLIFQGKDGRVAQMQAVVHPGYGPNRSLLAVYALGLTGGNALAQVGRTQAWVRLKTELSLGRISGTEDV